jgi:hypothetical protein
MSWTASIEAGAVAEDAGAGVGGKAEAAGAQALREITAWTGRSVYAFLQTRALDQAGLALALVTVAVQLCSYAVFLHESIVCLVGLAECSLQGGILKVEGLANFTSGNSKLPRVSFKCVAWLVRSLAQLLACGCGC